MYRPKRKRHTHTFTHTAFICTLQRGTIHRPTYIQYNKEEKEIKDPNLDTVWISHLRLAKCTFCTHTHTQTQTTKTLFWTVKFMRHKTFVCLHRSTCSQQTKKRIPYDPNTQRAQEIHTHIHNQQVKVHCEMYLILLLLLLLLLKLDDLSELRVNAQLCE